MGQAIQEWLYSMGPVILAIGWDETDIRGRDWLHKNRKGQNCHYMTGETLARV